MTGGCVSLRCKRGRSRRKDAQLDKLMRTRKEDVTQPHVAGLVRAHRL
jgi:hypothetical protein